MHTFSLFSIGSIDTLAFSQDNKHTVGAVHCLVRLILLSSLLWIDTERCYFIGERIRHWIDFHDLDITVCYGTSKKAAEIDVPENVWKFSHHSLGCWAHQRNGDSIIPGMPPTQTPTDNRNETWDRWATATRTTTKPCQTASDREKQDKWERSQPREGNAAWKKCQDISSCQNNKILEIIL